MKKRVGRPTKFDEATIKKLEEAFAFGCNDVQACAYAEISGQIFYPYIKKNPKFLERINRLKENPVLKARKTIYDSLDDPQTAKWFLERKLRDEFGSSQTFLNLSGNQLPPFQLILEGSKSKDDSDQNQGPSIKEQSIKDIPE